MCDGPGSEEWYRAAQAADRKPVRALHVSEPARIAQMLVGTVPPDLLDDAVNNHLRARTQLMPLAEPAMADEELIAAVRDIASQHRGEKKPLDADADRLINYMVSDEGTKTKK